MIDNIWEFINQNRILSTILLTLIVLSIRLIYHYIGRTGTKFKKTVIKSAGSADLPKSSSYPIDMKNELPTDHKVLAKEAAEDEEWEDEEEEEEEGEWEWEVEDEEEEGSSGPYIGAPVGAADNSPEVEGGKPNIKDPDPSYYRNGVNFTVMSPWYIKPGSDFILDIWAHEAKDFRALRDMANRLKRDQVIGSKAGLKIQKGETIMVKIEIPDLIIEDTEDFIIYEGDPTNASFAVRVPKELDKDTVLGKAIIKISGVRICKVIFFIKLSKNDYEDFERVPQSIKHIETAFASYSSKDREEVLHRLQGINIALPELDIFLDVIKLRAGSNWEKELKKHVSDRDVFYLFWSVNAANSKWVNNEWQMALKSRGLGYIDPIPLVSPSIATPPPELKSLHFNDAYLAHIEYEKLRKASRN